MTPEAEIRRRIRERGPITFAEFMEVALYWPGGGYYSGNGPGAGAQAGPVGPHGDYYTSPLAHPAFGALLALQLYQFWLLLERPAPFYAVELGAGSGQLGRDILNAAAALPAGFPGCLRYLRLDRGAGVGIGSDSEAAGPPGAGWIATDGVPLRNLVGCILSNELLDAFPVHQVRVQDGELREVYVTVADAADARAGALAEVLGQPSTPALAVRLEQLGLRLDEGQTAELNLELDRWAASVAGALAAGFVLTIDYGRPAKELYSSELRPRGALTTYYRHVQTDAPLRNVGSQDITAQVDFTSVIDAGRRAGLESLGFTTQRQFLQNLGLDRLRRRVTSMPLPVAQGVANRAGLLALSRPEGLGDFKILVQGRNRPGSSPDSHREQPALWGLEPAAEVLDLVVGLPVPLLTDRHISLPQGWPQPAAQEFEFTDLWPGPFGDA